MILLRSQVFFLWSFWRWFAIWTSRGFVRIVRPANRRPGTTLPVFPWSPRCKTGVLPQGAALPPDMPPHAGIFALVQVFFRICLFFQHVRQYPFHKNPKKHAEKQKTAGISANGLSAVYFPGCRSERFDYQIPPVSRFTPSDSSSVSACLLLQTRMLHCQ